MLLSGEAGIGKSRLTAALLETLASEPHTRLRYFCSPQHTDSAFYPIIGQMERAAGLAHEDTSQAKLDKLDAVLAQTSTSRQDAALIADMLSLPNDGRYPALDLAPEQRRQRTMEALIAQMEALTRQTGADDLRGCALDRPHEPGSVRSGSLTDFRPFACLLIVTFRPEFEPPWIGRPHVTALTINRLAQRDIEAMIDGVVGNKPLPASVRQDIIERTDGIPLFVEEMTKAVLEAGSEGEAQATAAAISSPALAVPASLHASLMARLDRLGPAKEVAQIGAAIGREFSHALLGCGSAQAGSRTGSRHSTVSLQLVCCSGKACLRMRPTCSSTHWCKTRPTARCCASRDARFTPASPKHLEDQFADIAENQPELLARHCTEAGLIEKAAGLWGKAGQRSLERSALVEAAEQLKRALAQIASLPATTALRREQIKLQIALMNPLMHVKGFGAPETKAAAEQARALIEQAEALGEPPEDRLLLFSVLYSFWVANCVVFNGDAMRELAAQFLTLAEKQRAIAPLMIGHRLMGVSMMFTGNSAQARAHYDQAHALYDRSEHRPLATRFGADIGVTILSSRSIALWVLGYPKAALADADQALKDAREIGQAATLMHALSWTSLSLIHCGSYTEAIAQCDELLALTDEKGSLFWKALATVHQGCVFALTGKASDAVQMMTSGIAAVGSTGQTLWMPSFLAYFAIAHAELGEFDNAGRCISEAITAMATTSETWFEAEVYRVAGETALKSPEPDVAKAKACFERALTVARQQQAKSWELRAAMSMARLWRDQGKRDEARDLLAPVYGWFTEGFDTLDLKEAKALLDELSA